MVQQGEKRATCGLPLCFPVCYAPLCFYPVFYRNVFFSCTILIAGFKGFKFPCRLFAKAGLFSAFLFIILRELLIPWRRDLKLMNCQLNNQRFITKYHSYPVLWPVEVFSSKKNRLSVLFVCFFLPYASVQSWGCFEIKWHQKFAWFC